jgi:hypothetical protein
MQKFREYRLANLKRRDENLKRTKAMQDAALKMRMERMQKAKESQMVALQRRNTEREKRMGRIMGKKSGLVAGATGAIVGTALVAETANAVARL